MTIYALSTGPGISGIAVIRVSGVGTKDIIKMLTKAALPKPRMATVRKINNINTSELIDEGIILWFPGPQSYTGEDMAEFHVHGSKAVIHALQNNLSKVKNCKLAEPGEFTKRAFYNGKVNLLKAESIADLISSETEIQRKQALRIMSGTSENEFNTLKKDLLKILSHIEAKIDFPDEDLKKNILEDIKKNSNIIIKKLKKILNDQKIGEIIREGFRVAIIGPVNAGKSSLINYFAKRDAAIVSNIEGTTRDIIELNIVIDGLPLTVCDTAGIRDSKNKIEKEGIKKALEKAKMADLKLIIIDAKKPNLNGFLRDLLDKNSILVVNKSDLLKKDLSSKIKKYNHILISIKKKKKFGKTNFEDKKKIRKKINKQ